MNTEVEAKFLNAAFDAVRKKLRDTGAECTHPMRVMKRAIIDHPIHTNAFLRVRDEGDRVTLTYKQFDSLSVSGAKEIETEVASFDAAIRIFEAMNMVIRSVQESKRETWQLDNAEIVLDEWPWLKPYIEIEAPDALTVQQTAETLGFNWYDAVFGDVMAAYRAEYPHLSPDDTIATLPEVRFGAPLPGMLKHT